jgi:hypothetical protein
MIEPRFTSEYTYRTKLVVPDAPWAIYGHPANFAYFVNTPLVEAEAGAREYQNSPRRAHARRRYIGDQAPANVPATTYGYVHDPGRRTGNAIPGWSFILDDGIERRQFTTTADVVTLIAYLEDDIKNKTRLYTQGASYVIAPAAAEG